MFERRFVAVPSMNRSGSVKVHGTLYVPERQMAAYESFSRVVGVPDDIVGIGATRQYILDYATERGYPYVVMLDDDLRFGYRINQRQSVGTQTDDHVMTWFDTVMRGSNCHVASITPRFMMHAKPLIIKDYGPVGCCYAIKLPTECRFDRVRQYEDTDFAIQCYKAGKNVWINQAFYHSQARDNTSDPQRVERELASIKRLQELHPEYVSVTERYDRPQLRVAWKKLKEAHV